MEIRRYEPADRDEVAALWTSLFPGSTGHNDPQDAIDRKVRCADGLFFVATDRSAVIGTVLAGYDGHRGWLYSLAVATNRQRRGVATQLVRHAEQALVRLGCPKVNLQVRADNADVVAFYNALGFVAEDRISMGKLLSPAPPDSTTVGREE